MVTLTSPEAMQAWGKKLAPKLHAGDVIALIGGLGAGKTTLVQGIAAGWGYSRRANSPTFALVNEYPSPRGLLLHMDMYRLSPREITAFPLEDYLDSRSICLIEWADRLGQDRWPKNTLEIRIETVDPKTRRIHLSSPLATWQKRIKPLIGVKPL